MYKYSHQETEDTCDEFVFFKPLSFKMSDSHKDRVKIVEESVYHVTHVVPKYHKTYDDPFITDRGKSCGYRVMCRT